jgi:hypothetical protein
MAETPRELVAGDRKVSGPPSSRPAAGVLYALERPGRSVSLPLRGCRIRSFEGEEPVLHLMGWVGRWGLRGRFEDRCVNRP